MENIVEVNSLKKTFENNFVALNNITFNLKKGGIIGLLGPNGAGKTTLIKILAGMITDYTGEVKINGHSLGVETKKIVSYLPDVDFINPSWTVKYALEYYSDFFDDFDKEKAIILFEKLSISLNKKFKTLSKGTREKVQLVLTLSRNALLYVFDEPIAGVDPAARELIFNLILDNYNKNGTLIISTHFISEAEKILTEFMFIKNGEIIRKGNVKSVVENQHKSIDEIFREDFKCLKDF